MAKTESHIPKLRFSGFSDPWQKFRIIDVADYVDYRGKTPTKTLSGILLVTAKNIRQGFIDYDVSQEFISEDEFDDVMSRGKVQIGDVLITTEAPLGNVASIDRADIALAQRVIKYRGKQNILNNRFLKYRFLTSSFQKLLETKATGGTVQGIKGSTLHKLLIRISCDINEQTKIGDFFQKIDQVIELQQSTLDTARDYKKAMLQKMFPQKGEKVPQVRFDGFSGDWEEVKFSKIYSFIRNGFVGVATPYYVEQGITYIQGRNIKSGKLLNNGYIHITKEFHESRPNSIVRTNDLLMVQSGHVGESAVVTDEFSGSNCHAILIASPKENKLCNSFFYMNYFSSEVGIKKVHMITTGNTIKHILSSDLKEIIVPKISCEEQQKIGAFFQKLDQQIEQQEKKLENYQQLKKAMLQRMFV